jgi:ribosomal-protein-alanine N-acetyltransferase
VISVRALDVADLDVVVAMEEELFPEPWTRRLYVSELRESSRCYVAALDDGRFAGWAGIAALAGEAHLMTIATLPDFQRRGIGRILLASMVEAAKAFACDRILLEVATTNTAAQALYRAFHFAPVGVRRNYYPSTGDDALVMVKTVEETS